MTDQTTHDVMVAQTQKAQELLDYFQGFRTNVDARVAALTASLSVKVFIDEIAGNDAALGGEQTPVKTLTAAIGRVPAGSFGTIVFKTDVTVAENINTRARGLLFVPYQSARPVLKSGWWEDSEGLLRPGQIFFAGSSGSVGFDRVNMHFEARPAGTPASSWNLAFLRTNSVTPPPFLGLFECTITRADGAAASFVASGSGTAVLSFGLGVTWPTTMSGNWFAGVAAGTPTAATRYNTSLTTL